MPLRASFLSLALAALPAPGMRLPDPPRLAIQPPGRLDLGELGPLERRLQRYVITNTSAAPILLRLLELPPGVTVEGAALEGPLGPGARAELALRVDPAGWVGAQRRSVLLGTDDPLQGRYRLPVSFRVRPDLTVDRERVDLGEVEVPESPRACFTFVRETGEPLLLRLPPEPPPHLDLDLEGQGRPRATLGVTLRSAQVAPGVRRGFEHLPVETNAPGQPHVDLYLSWGLRHPIEAEPSRVLFADGLSRAALTLTARGGRGFRIREIRLEGLGFRVESLQGEGEPSQVLRLRSLAQGPARAMLVLAFQGEDGCLRVPLTCLP